MHTRDNGAKQLALGGERWKQKSTVVTYATQSTHHLRPEEQSSSVNAVEGGGVSLRLSMEMDLTVRTSIILPLRESFKSVLQCNPFRELAENTKRLTRGIDSTPLRHVSANSL